MNPTHTGPLPTPAQQRWQDAEVGLIYHYDLSIASGAHSPNNQVRQVFDLADWDTGVATSAPGQSGQPGSPHYADLAPLWAKGRYFPLAFSRKKVEEVTQHRLVLKPVN